jgi:chromosomal replication initiator protein
MKAASTPRLGTAQSKITAIQVLVARMFNMNAEELATSRKASTPCQIAMYLAKSETDASLVEIASLFGGEDHGAVLHAIGCVDDLRRTDPATDLAIEILRKILQVS